MKRIVIAVTAIAVLLFALAATPAYSTERAAGATAAKADHQDCATGADVKNGTCECCANGCTCCMGGTCVCKDSEGASCKGGKCKPKACDKGRCRTPKK
jgi:hypothetical protein